jgi:hypothetical protein
MKYATNHPSISTLVLSRASVGKRGAIFADCSSPKQITALRHGRRSESRGQADQATRLLGFHAKSSTKKFLAHEPQFRLFKRLLAIICAEPGFRDDYWVRAEALTKNQMISAFLTW